MCGTLPHTDSTQKHVLALLCIMEGQSRLKVLLQSMVEYLVLSFMTKQRLLYFIELVKIVSRGAVLCRVSVCRGVVVGQVLVSSSK
jgi:hypothetical protein